MTVRAPPGRGQASDFTVPHGESGAQITNADSSFLSAKYCVAGFEKLAHEPAPAAQSTHLGAMRTKIKVGAAAAGLPGHGGARVQRVPGTGLLVGAPGGGSRNLCLGATHCESIPGGIYPKNVYFCRQQTTHLLSISFSPHQDLGAEWGRANAKGHVPPPAGSPAPPQSFQRRRSPACPQSPGEARPQLTAAGHVSCFCLVSKDRASFLSLPPPTPGRPRATAESRFLGLCNHSPMTHQVTQSQLPVMAGGLQH